MEGPGPDWPEPLETEDPQPVTEEGPEDWSWRTLRRVWPVWFWTATTALWVWWRREFVTFGSMAAASAYKPAAA